MTQEAIEDGQPVGLSAHVPAVAPEADEGPVKAIKRLRATYPMLDAKDLLDETTTIMSKRYLQGKPEGEVIEELEETFERHYHRYLDRFEG